MHVSREYFKRNMTALVKKHVVLTIGGSEENPEMVLASKPSFKKFLVFSSCEFREDFANIANAITLAGIQVEVQVNSEPLFYLKRCPYFKSKYEKYVKAYTSLKGG